MHIHELYAQYTFLFLILLYFPLSIVCGPSLPISLLLPFSSYCPLSIPSLPSPPFPSAPLSSSPLPSPPLHTDQASLTRQLQSLPLRSDTLKHKLKRAELETKLAEIDDALKIFSRPKVFVKTDD